MTSGSDADKLAARYYAAGHWSRGSIWESFEAAASQGRHAVVLDDEGTVGLPALLDRARRIAGGFALAGLAHGDTVLINPATAWMLSQPFSPASPADMSRHRFRPSSPRARSRPLRAVPALAASCSSTAMPHRVRRT